jgi:glucokinase
MKKILAADIGGTNSRFAHFGLDRSGVLALSEIYWLKTKESSSFADLLGNLKRSGFSLNPEESDVAVFAVAGPVEDGVRSSPPFISWPIDISCECTDNELRCPFLINDFVAQAYACRTPVGKAAEQILPGEIRFDATSAVIGAGTGLGKAALVPDGKGGYLAVPSEGGHTDFPCESEKEFDFYRFMITQLGDSYLTGNKVVSGAGLSLIHEFLTGDRLQPDQITERLLDFSETLQWASRFYGRVCRNYALETLALAGLYIAGGVAARNPELVQHTSFRNEFRSSDTLAHILEQIPVFLISDQNSGLWGAAQFGLQKLKESIDIVEEV